MLHIRNSLILLSILLVALLALVAAPAGARGPNLPPLATGSVAPDFAADSWSGGKMHLSDLRGKIVIVDFWASWCGPCNEAMPGLQEVLDQYKKDIVVLALNVWDTPNDASTWINGHNYTFTFARDPIKDGAGSISETYHVSAIPTTYVIDPSGKVVTSMVGYGGSDDDLVAAIRTLGARTEEEHAQVDAAESVKDGAADSDGVRPGEMLLTGTVSKAYSGDGNLSLSVSSVRLFGKETTPLSKPRTKIVFISLSTHLRGEDPNNAKPLRFDAGDHIQVIGQDEGVGQPLMARLVVLPKPAK